MKIKLILFVVAILPVYASSQNLNAQFLREENEFKEAYKNNHVKEVLIRTEIFDKKDPIEFMSDFFSINKQGNITKYQDLSGRKYQYYTDTMSYDEKGNLLIVLNYSITYDSDTLLEATHHKYDENGNLTSVCDYVFEESDFIGDGCLFFQYEKDKLICTLDEEGDTSDLVSYFEDGTIEIDFGFIKSKLKNDKMISEEYSTGDILFFEHNQYGYTRTSNNSDYSKKFKIDENGLPVSSEFYKKGKLTWRETYNFEYYK